MQRPVLRASVLPGPTGGVHGVRGTVYPHNDRAWRHAFQARHLRRLLAVSKDREIQDVGLGASN